MILALPLLAGLALAADPLLEERANGQRAAADGVEPRPALGDAGFRFLGLVQVRPMVTDILTTNPLFDGQLVGVLGGSNQTDVYVRGETDLDGDGTPDVDLGDAWFTEQRVVAFLSYAPPVLDGRVALKSAFEIDFAFGDSAYGTGGNVGGGFGGDQVNLQTRRLNVSAKAIDRPRHDLTVVTGLQFLADGATDPSTAQPDDLLRAGGGLMFFGSEAAGISAFGRIRGASGELVDYRAGAFTLVEQGTSLDDDVSLLLADLQAHPAYGWRVGGHFWTLRDHSGGSGGYFGYGPTSQLSALQGGPDLDLRQGEDAAAPETDTLLYTLAFDGGYNHRLDQGRYGFTALGAMQWGALLVTAQPDVPIRGWLVDGEARARFAPGKGSVVRLEATASSRDGTGPDAYTGVLTGNAWGIVGAAWGRHGNLLLFPDSGAINRQVAVVYDVSNQGQGLLALTADAGYDLIRNQLNASLGTGWAQDGNGESMGTELHARLSYEPWPLFKLSGAAATLMDTGFDARPWVAFAALEWVVF